ncbi:DUF4244 domain-containing protein [Streptomyces sp. NPDC015130]|uniref:DUF4244 domain-containing protein n=1 Tax=Streptomyces sp. NPDC015130 TaxID=3364940 RepID=UPI0036F55FAD
MTNTVSTTGAKTGAGVTGGVAASRPERRGPVSAVREWWRARRRGLRSDSGMTTSEYAVGTIAAAAFAAVLYKLVTGGTVSGALESVIGKALDAPF